MKLTLAVCVQVKLTRTLRPSHAALIQLTWMRKTKRCFRNVELDSPTQRVRKLKERPAKSSLKKPEGWHKCKSSENSKQLAFRFSSLPRLEA
jgi:hypothetical protein